jgi:FdhD protein
MAEPVITCPVFSVHEGHIGEMRDDRVAVEAPLELRVDGRALTVIMRTPGRAGSAEDEELVRGFLFSEGIIVVPEDLVSLERPERLVGDEIGNVIEVRLRPGRAVPRLDRVFYASSSCGVCGKASIASLAVRAEEVRSALRLPRSVLLTLPDRLRGAQPRFSETGGLHASGLFTADGALVTAREDVGRHNALDKLIGWALGAHRLPLAECALAVSGRVSYEIVQKAITAGLPLVAAVGAPSSLAIDLAEQFGVTLCGFVRGASANVYSHRERVG